MTQQDKFAIIVAGGSGTRMSSNIPKQFIEIGEKPILMHTLEAFDRYDAEIKIILVLPRSEQSVWEDLIDRHSFKVLHRIIDGGNSRFSSVKNGLSAIPDGSQGLVAIHDGVRPFVSSAMIDRSFEMAASSGNAIAAVVLKESIRKIADESSQHVPRTGYRLIQTPQTFAVAEIKAAFKQEEKETFTDDASVLEANGGKIHLYEGDYRNIKITTPDDLLWAEAFLAQSNQ
ncbi:MAG: 2-C-methyl-D-erythritol 4-phosphate cytidylyltransferase [Cyclobacteriaceae bacterium]